MIEDPFSTIGASLVVSIMGMLAANVAMSGWRTNKITSGLRETISTHVNDLHRKIDANYERLRMQIDGGLRVIDDKFDHHALEDANSFGTLRRETGEMGHALREKMHTLDDWNRDNFLQVKHFDEKIASINLRMDHQDQLLSKIEKNGTAKH